MCVCVCVCVWGVEREERGKKWEKEKSPRLFTKKGEIVSRSLPFLVQHIGRRIGVILQFHDFRTQSGPRAWRTLLRDSVAHGLAPCHAVRLAIRHHQHENQARRVRGRVLHKQHTVRDGAHFQREVGEELCTRECEDGVCDGDRQCVFVQLKRNVRVVWDR